MYKKILLLSTLLLSCSLLLGMESGRDDSRDNNSNQLSDSPNSEGNPNKEGNNESPLENFKKKLESFSPYYENEEQRRVNKKIIDFLDATHKEPAPIFNKLVAQKLSHTAHDANFKGDTRLAEEILSVGESLMFRFGVFRGAVNRVDQIYRNPIGVAKEMAIGMGHTAAFLGAVLWQINYIGLLTNILHPEEYKKFRAEFIWPYINALGEKIKSFKDASSFDKGISMGAVFTDLLIMELTGQSLNLALKSTPPPFPLQTGIAVATECIEDARLAGQTRYLLEELALAHEREAAAAGVPTPPHGVSVKYFKELCTENEKITLGATEEGICGIIAEKQEVIKGPLQRSKEASADFCDSVGRTTTERGLKVKHGTPWDVKSPRSKYTDLPEFIKRLKKDFNSGENILINSFHLTNEHVAHLIQGLEESLTAGELSRTVIIFTEAQINYLNNLKVTIPVRYAKIGVDSWGYSALASLDEIQTSLAQSNLRFNTNGVNSAATIGLGSLNQLQMSPIQSPEQYEELIDVPEELLVSAAAQATSGDAKQAVIDPSSVNKNAIMESLKYGYFLSNKYAQQYDLERAQKKAQLENFKKCFTASHIVNHTVTSLKNLWETQDKVAQTLLEKMLKKQQENPPSFGGSVGIQPPSAHEKNIQEGINRGLARAHWLLAYEEDPELKAYIDKRREEIVEIILTALGSPLVTETIMARLILATDTFEGPFNEDYISLKHDLALEHFNYQGQVKLDPPSQKAYQSVAKFLKAVCADKETYRKYYAQAKIKNLSGLCTIMMEELQKEFKRTPYIHESGVKESIYWFGGMSRVQVRSRIPDNQFNNHILEVVSLCKNNQFRDAQRIINLYDPFKNKSNRDILESIYNEFFKNATDKYGISPQFANDPLYRHLPEEKKQLLLSDKNQLEALKATLAIRHVLRKKIEKMYKLPATLSSFTNDVLYIIVEHRLNPSQHSDPLDRMYMDTTLKSMQELCKHFYNEKGISSSIEYNGTLFEGLKWPQNINNENNVLIRKHLNNLILFTNEENKQLSRHIFKALSEATYAQEPLRSAYLNYVQTLYKLFAFENFENIHKNIIYFISIFTIECDTESQKATHSDLLNFICEIVTELTDPKTTNAPYNVSFQDLMRTVAKAVVRLNNANKQNKTQKVNELLLKLKEALKSSEGLFGNAHSNLLLLSQKPSDITEVFKSLRLIYAIIEEIDKI